MCVLEHKRQRDRQNCSRGEFLIAIKPTLESGL